MRLIHATVLDNGLLGLWIEDCQSQWRCPLPRGTRLEVHPYATDEPLTQEAIRILLDLPEGICLPVHTVTLHLPTRAGEPISSQEDEVDSLVGDVDVDDDFFIQDEVTDEPELAAWGVAACVLRPSEATLLIAHLPTNPTPGLRLAPDLEVWSAAARWTLSLLRRGRLVPELVYEGAAVEGIRRAAAGCARVGWVPALDAEGDAACLARLVDALPPSGRCHAAEPPPARDVITAFVSTAVQDLARHWIARSGAGSPPTAGSRGPAALPLAWPAACRAWVEALRRGEGTAEGSVGDLAELAEEVRRWQRDLLPTDRRLDFRTGFRLEAPDDADGAWNVFVFLEAVDEPSVCVPAREVWSGDPDLLERGAYRLEHPQEKLLSDLGRALRVFPALERMLEARPNTPTAGEGRPPFLPSRPASAEFSAARKPAERAEGLTLGLPEASQFIRSTAWLLQESGFAVQVPSWATDPSAAPRLVLTAREQAGDAGDTRFGLEMLLEYEWRVALGADVMDPREFERLANTKVPLVLLRDGWALIEPTPAAGTLALLAARDGVDLSLRDALQLAAGADRAQDGLTPVELMLEGELAALGDAQHVAAVAPPVGLMAQLRPYQAQGFSWMADRIARGLSVCLADDMGLGKTVQIIALLLHDRGHGPWLLVCPTSLVGNWMRELERFAPSLRTAVYHGRSRETDWDAADIVLTTYGLAGRDATLQGRLWRGVALDEAQNVKNADSRQARGVRELHSEVRIAMTGTPVENRLADLWSIMEFLNPGLLGTTEMFRRRFAIPIEKYANEDRRMHLRRAVSPFLLRRVKTDPTVIPDLPEKRERKVYCSLTREQASLYEATVNERLGRIESSDGITRRGVVLSTMLRLKQICNHPAHFLDDGSTMVGRSGKLARLEEKLDEIIAGGERALVFTQFREWAIRLATYLQGRLGTEVPCLHGETPREERDRLVARFQSGEGAPVFVLSVKAGGVGLNLTGATHVFHFDRWWNPAVENQATDRAFRIGQRRDVEVHKFVCLGTLEEAIDRLLESKRGLAESVVGSGEGWLTELTTGELRDMFTLRETAMEDDESC